MNYFSDARVTMMALLELFLKDSMARGLLLEVFTSLSWRRWLQRLQASLLMESLVLKAKFWLELMCLFS